LSDFETQTDDNTINAAFIWKQTI